MNVALTVDFTDLKWAISDTLEGVLRDAGVWNEAGEVLTIDFGVDAEGMRDLQAKFVATFLGELGVVAEV